MLAERLAPYRVSQRHGGETKMASRDLITLRELVARLRPHEEKGIDAERTIFTDLRLGTLHSVAVYPKYLETRPAIPASYWAALSFEEFLGKPNRGGRRDDIFIPVSIFVEAEKKRLSDAIRAVKAKKVERIDETLKAHFQSKGWLGDKLETDKIIAFCQEAQEGLKRDAPDRIVTTAYVSAEAVPSYLATIEERLGTAKKEKGFRWEELYEELLRMMIIDPTALDFGKVDGTLEKVRTWALTKYPGDEVPGEKTLRKQVDDNIIHIARPKKPK